jgi:alpha-L-rhamnosidase
MHMTQLERPRKTQKARFEKAEPIWLKGLSETMNVTAGVRTVFKARQGEHVLRMTGASVYRIRLNGEFVGHGPARCGHGFYRVDEWRLPVVEGENVLAIEVAGYNANSFVYLDQPSFVQAEVVAGTRLLAATGGATFSAYRLKERVQKVQRYSFQRTFVEAYRLTPRSSGWYDGVSCKRKTEAIEVLGARKLTGRGVPYPHWETKQPVAITASGSVRPLKDPKLRRGREWSGPRDDFKAFPANKQTLFPAHELEALVSTVRSRKVRPYGPAGVLELKPKGFKILDLGTNLTGFIGLHVVCDEPVDLYLSFDELAMESGDVSLTRYGCANVIKYSLKPGCYDLESIEPYTLKYLKLIAMDGACRVTGVYLREYACSDAQRGRFAASDHQLSELFEAARQTFRQNSTDIFMDCPGRERAGWLCDSFFTARAERDLCGGNPIERNFFENYLLPKRYPHHPKGMLPMCYPSDHTDGNFIPTWAMWFVIELEEHLYRSSDRELIDGLKQKVYGLIDYFKPFLNADGLLEKLDKWIFIEWSEAAKFVQDVSYPSNMVYAGMLDAAGMLYGDEVLIEQAAAVRETIREQSFDGEFFVDNAVREDDGTLGVTRNRTETCQYYAFFFDVATPKSHAELWQKVLTEFGPERDPTTQWPEIHPSNAFIGFFLRLDILSRYEQNALILDQLYKHYLPMAQTTGTLWEHKDTAASCNHGFASHVAHILYRDILGIHFDPVSKTVEFRIPDIDLEWCEGRIPVGNDWIEAKWVKSGETISYQLSVPKGFTPIVKNQSGLPSAM